MMRSESPRRQRVMDVVATTQLYSSGDAVACLHWYVRPLLNNDEVDCVIGGPRSCLLQRHVQHHTAYPGSQVLPVFVMKMPEAP